LFVLFGNNSDFLGVGIIQAAFGIDDSENVGDGLLQKGAICAGWKLFHSPI